MYIRVNTYEKFGLPGRPQIDVRIMTGPWNEEQRRAEMLKRHLENVEWHREHTLEIANIDSSNAA